RLARNIAHAAGIDDVHAELLPRQKVEIVEQLKQQKLRVAMVGDGINDAPALACADVGVAMGMTGADIAIEEADIVLMNDRLERLPLLVEVSRATINIIWQNIWIFAFAVNAASVAAAATGIIGPAAAAAAHQASALLVVLNSLRLLAYGKLKQNLWLTRGRRLARDLRHRARHSAEDHLPQLSLPQINLHAARHWLAYHRPPIVKPGLAVLALLYLLSGVTPLGQEATGGIA